MNNLIILFIGVLVLLVMVVALVVLRAESGHRRKALEHRRETDASGLALVRYIQLNRQCSEDVSYERIARFVKNHIPFDDHGFIDRMLVYDRQSLLDSARSILARDPNGIDKI